MPNDTATPDPRAEFIASLRELADFYEQHPDLPAPAYPVLRLVVRGADAPAGVAEVERIASILGADVNRDYHVGTGRQFGSVEFNAFYVLPEVSAEFHQREEAGHAAVPRVAHVAALAALAEREPAQVSA